MTVSPRRDAPTTSIALTTTGAEGRAHGPPLPNAGRRGNPPALLSVIDGPSD